MARKLEAEAVRDLRSGHPDGHVNAEFEARVAEKYRGLLKEMKDLK